MLGSVLTTAGTGLITDANAASVVAGTVLATGVTGAPDIAPVGAWGESAAPFLGGERCFRFILRNVALQIEMRRWSNEN
jgi:hypothetical protein